MQKDCGGTQDGYGDGVTDCVEQAQLHALAPRALYARDVGDGGKVVIVEAVAQAEKRAGKQGEFERGRHVLLLGYGC